MTELSVRHAVTGDLGTVHAILHSVADWLHSRGIDQWPDDSPNFGLERLGAQIGRGEMHLVLADGRPIGTIALSPRGDADFWLPHELAEPAVYVSKASVIREYAGEGIGALALRWAVDQAHAAGARWLRLDAWRTNTVLHDYYAGQDWDYVRTVEAAGRKSGVLFRRLALADSEARAAVAGGSALPRFPEPAVPPAAWPVGTPVVTQDWRRAVVEQVHSRGWGTDVTEAGWERGMSHPPVSYTLRFENGGTAIVAGPEITHESALAVM